MGQAPASKILEDLVPTSNAPVKATATSSATHASTTPREPTASNENHMPKLIQTSGVPTPSNISPHTPPTPLTAESMFVLISTHTTQITTLTSQLFKHALRLSGLEAIQTVNKIQLRSLERRVQEDRDRYEQKLKREAMQRRNLREVVRALRERVRVLRDRVDGLMGVNGEGSEDDGWGGSRDGDGGGSESEEEVGDGDEDGGDADDEEDRSESEEASEEEVPHHDGNSDGGFF